MRINGFGLRIVNESSFASARAFQIRNPQSQSQSSVKISSPAAAPVGHLMPALASLEWQPIKPRSCVGRSPSAASEARSSRTIRFDFICCRWSRSIGASGGVNLRWPVIAVRAWRAAGQVLRDEQPASRHRQRRITRRAGRVARAETRHSDRPARAERVSRLTQRWLTRRRAPGAPRVSRSAAPIVAESQDASLRVREIDHCTKRTSMLRAAGTASIGRSGGRCSCRWEPGRARVE